MIRTLAAATHTRGVVGLIGGSMPGTELVLDHNAMLLGRSVRGIIEGDANPQKFIPELIEYHMSGQLPFDRLVKRYGARDFAQAITDARAGETIKPILEFSPIEP